MMKSCGRARVFVPAFVSFVSFAWCSGAVAAPAGEVVLSLSGTGDLGVTTVQDEEVLLASGTGPARLLVDGGTLALHFGDRDQDGLDDVPGDLDALEVVPVGAGTPWIAGVYFSLVSDQAGIQDGDVVRFDPGGPNGGLEVVWSEAQIQAAIQANDGNVDVDAIAIAADGALWFSLAEDEASGPSATVIADDDVLRLPPGATTAEVAFTGAQLEAMVQTALGSSATIGDVKGIDVDATQMIFTVQSPSSDDATVFSTLGGGSVHLAESGMGFFNAAEADAVAFFHGVPFPAPSATAANPKANDAVTVDVFGATPGQPFVLLLSGVVVPAGAAPALAGYGTLALDPQDPMFLVGLLNSPALASVADGNGNGAISGKIPSSASPYDLGIQVLDTATGRVSAPIVLEVNQ